ncbi:MAG: DUF3343 domain-containing protein [Bacillota bacterium]|nr:DUF3343 domain-containing protein [Bacillota bacterium]
MRATSPKVVVTFATTVNALAMERSCTEWGIPGRIIPVPTKISAGCGLAWCAELQYKEQIVAFLNEKQLAYADVYMLD